MPVQKLDAMKAPLDFSIMKWSLPALAVILGLGLSLLLPCCRAAAAEGPKPAAAPGADAAEMDADWLDAVDASWGGYLKLRGALLWPEAESLWGAVDSTPYTDGSAEGRLNTALFFSDWIRFDAQYEMVFSGGDSRRNATALSDTFSGPIFDGLRISPIPDDDDQVMDLTSVIEETDSSVWYQRIDRLALTVSKPVGTLRVGRQAVTWGNGLVFNPMDLFNPFRPTDIEREYKLGTDMAYAQLPWRERGNLQLLYVPRRNPDTGDIEGDQSSLAGDLHLFWGTTEFDLMAAKHYEDAVAGIGSVGYLGSAAWRLDATWTVLDSESPSDNYLSMVANMDMSWVWWQKNFYGFIEFYYNGLGDDDYQAALANPDILKRLDRGELFVLGRYYLTALVQVELHPLLNLFITDITNIKDPSGILQPRVVWDVFQDVQLIAGGNIFYGARGTEYGGIDIPGTGYTTRTPDSAYLWVSYYF